MKKISVYIAVLLFALSLVACSAPAPMVSPAPTTAVPTASPTEQPSPTVELSSPTVAAIIIDKDQLDEMLPLFQSIILTTYNGAYSATDPDIFWIAMYYTCVNIGDKHPDVEIVDDGSSIKVPTKVIEEYASALFTSFLGIPALPKDYGITYLNEEKAYSMMLSDSGDIEVNISSFKPIGDDQISVSVRISSPSEPDNFEDYTFILVNNPYFSSTEHITFSYSVVSVEKEVGEPVTFETEDGKVTATIFIPQGWSYKFYTSRAGVRIINDEGEFTFCIVGGGVGTPKATDTGGRIIAGYEMRGQATDKIDELIGVIADDWKAYVFSSTFDLNGPVISDILDTIIITVN